MPCSLNHLLLINLYMEIYKYICYLILRISTVWNLYPLLLLRLSFKL